jgi:hypothetical protein
MNAAADAATGARMPVALIGAGTVGRMHAVRMVTHRHVVLAGIADPAPGAAGRPNGGVLVDAIHFARLGSTLAQVAALPREWLHYAHICDAAAMGYLAWARAAVAATRRVHGI